MTKEQVTILFTAIVSNNVFYIAAAAASAAYN